MPVNPPKMDPETPLVPGLSRFARYRDKRVEMARNDRKNHKSVLENYATAHSRRVRKTLLDPTDSITPHTHLHASPIGTAKHTRLPPWEDFQRGPQSVHAETLLPGPHRKSFTFADLRGSVVCRGAAFALRTFV